MKKIFLIMSLFLVLGGVGNSLYAQKGVVEFYMIGGPERFDFTPGIIKYEPGGSTGVGLKYYVKERLYCTGDMIVSMSAHTEYSDGRRHWAGRRDVYYSTIGMGYDLLKTKTISMYVQNSLGIGYTNFSYPVIHYIYPGTNNFYYDDAYGRVPSWTVAPSLGIDFKLSDCFKAGVAYTGRYLYLFDYAQALNLKLSFVFH